MINRGHQFAKLSFHLLPHTITISYRSVTKTQLNHNNITSLLSRREISNYSDSPAATATTTMERSNCSPITIHRVVRPLNCFRENLPPPRPSALTGPRLESDLSNRFTSLPRSSVSDGVALASLGIFRFHHRKIRLYLFVATFFSYIRVSTAQDLIYYGEAINEYCSVVVLCLQNMYESCWQQLQRNNKKKRRGLV